MPAKPDIFMRLYIGDLLKHIGRLKDGDIGSYMLLMMDYWINGAPPDDDEILATIARCDAPTWARRRLLLAPLFEIEAGLWRQRRVERELAKAGTRVEKARDAANARHGRVARSTRQAAPEQCPGDASQSQDSPSQASPSTESRAILRRQNEQVTLAAGEALASMATNPGIASLASLRALLTGERPCDWDEDILPAVVSAAAWHLGRHGPGSMKSWTAAVRMASENRDRRLSGAPAPGKETSNGHAPTHAQRAGDQRRANLERAFAAPGVRAEV